MVGGDVGVVGKRKEGSRNQVEESEEDDSTSLLPSSPDSFAETVVHTAIVATVISRTTSHHSPSLPPLPPLQAPLPNSRFLSHDATNSRRALRLRPEQRHGRDLRCSAHGSAGRGHLVSLLAFFSSSPKTLTTLYYAGTLLSCCSGWRCSTGKASRSSRRLERRMYVHSSVFLSSSPMLTFSSFTARLAKETHPGRRDAA